MKKSIALLTVAAACLGLAACGSKDNASTNVAVDNLSVQAADDMLNDATQNGLDAASNALGNAADASANLAANAQSQASNAVDQLQASTANAMSDAGNAAQNASNAVASH